MKKVIVVLLLIANGFMMAQTKTLVTVNGEKVPFNPAGGWSTLGNAGTTPGTNFIGTMDDIDVIFKRGNVLGAILGNGESSIGLRAMGKSTGQDNSAFGVYALENTTTGYDNRAIGVYSLSFNTTGSANSAVGFQSLNVLDTGHSNTAIGYATLYNLKTGNMNTIVGAASGYGVDTGISNTIVGAYVGETTLGKALPKDLTRNIIIADGEGNQRIRVDANGNVGIGVEDLEQRETSDPIPPLTARLELHKGTARAAIKIVDRATVIPAGSILTSTTDGVASWASPPTPPVLDVRDGNLPSSGSNKIDFGGNPAGWNGGVNSVITGVNITLPPGKWIINVGLLIGPKGAAVTNVTPGASYGARFTLSSSSTNPGEKNGFDFVNDNNLVFNMVTIGPTAMPYAMFADGVMRVIITGSVNRQLFLWNVLSNEFGTAVGAVIPNESNYFYATKTN